MERQIPSFNLAGIQKTASISSDDVFSSPLCAWASIVQNRRSVSAAMRGPSWECRAQDMCGRDRAASARDLKTQYNCDALYQAPRCEFSALLHSSVMHRRIIYQEAF